MAFQPVDLPFTCDIRDSGTGLPRLTNVPCAVRTVGADHIPVQMAPMVSNKFFTMIIFAPGTDVRDGTDNAVTGADTIEMPSGAGVRARYEVWYVGDQYRGFPNEFRVALCTHVNGGTGARP